MIRHISVYTHFLHGYLLEDDVDLKNKTCFEQHYLKREDTMIA